jgi:hypothetical protein
VEQMSGREFTDHSPSAVRYECPSCGGWDRIIWYGDPQGGSRTLEHGDECYHCDAQIAVTMKISIEVIEK